MLALGTKMSEPTFTDYLGDPLGEITRKERRNLLIAGTVGVLVAEAGLVPSKISALGIDLSAPAQDAFVMLVGLVIVYFLCAFFIYGVSDFFAWRKKYQDYLEAVERLQGNWSKEDQARYDEIRTAVGDIAWIYSASKPVAFIRMFFEFGLPIIYGLFVASMLILYVICP